MSSIKRIEKITSEILQANNIKKRPIDIEKIANKLGLEIRIEDLGRNVSGVLIIKDGKGVIGYNPSENSSNVRRRFTIAHEIGHFLLHSHNEKIFVDKKAFRTHYRNSDSSSGEQKLEREANAFAASILMPRDLLLKDLDKIPFDLGDEQDSIKGLADKFQVSSQAMAFRLSNLGLF